MEGLWKSRALGGRDVCIPPFKTPTMDVSTLCDEDIMRDGYQPKMLSFMLDKLFYIYSQIKKLRRADKKIIVTYEILCLSTNWCTDRWHRLKKTGMPDALALLNVDDAHHLECLAWAVYDGALLVGLQPKLPGDRPWCTVLAGLHKHIYRGHNDAAHCPPHTLGSWNCQEWIEVLAQLRMRWAEMSIPTQEKVPKQLVMPLQDTGPGEWGDGHSCSSSPHMPLRSTTE